jgi:hypothetical protein
MQKEMGSYMVVQYAEGVEAFTILPFTTILGWSREEVQVFIAGVRAHIKDKSIHAIQD